MAPGKPCASSSMKPPKPSAEYLGAQPYERTEARRDYANGFKPKTMLTRFGNITVAYRTIA